MTYLSREQLEKLPRGKLQAIAKENNIKANQKSALIIEVYLDKHNLKSNAPKGGASNASNANNRESTPVNKMGRAQAPPPTDSLAPRQGLEEGSRKQDVEIVDDSDEEGSESDEECDEEEFQETIELLKSREAQDKEIIESIRLLRAASSIARDDIEKLKRLLFGQQSNRGKIEKYILYARPVKGGWPKDAVYCGDKNGKLKIQRRTNPGMFEQKYFEPPEEWEDDYIPPEDRAPGFRHFKKPVKAVKTELLVPPSPKSGFAAAQKRKRVDDENEQQEADRSAPRPRLSSDVKGKGKMTAEEVLALSAERQATEIIEEDEVEENDRIVVMNKLLEERGLTSTTSPDTSFVPPGHRSYETGRYPS